MGQGYSVIHPSAATAGIDAPELADLEIDRSFSGARFLKTLRARNKNGLVVVKVYPKPFASLSLDDRIQSLIAERRKLADVPNALAYHRILETPTSAYVVRQYVNSSLYDRISTNPPLEDIERRWIAFQLLCALKDCHARNVHHGDLKTDNLLLTSWNWLYLTDFSSCIKPHCLPEDNPVDFTLFYDTTARRVCYIAPERFVSSTHKSADKPQPLHDLQWTADIFSAGCVIAELFTEKPTFTLSQLFRYRKSEYDPLPSLTQDIANPHVRELVTHMIQLVPDDRYSADEYLNFWRGKVFPTYFYDFLHQYTHLITDPFSGQKPVIAGPTNNAESDDRIDRVYYDFDKAAVALNFTPTQPLDRDDAFYKTSHVCDLDSHPLIIDLPSGCRPAKERAEPSSDNGALLFSSIVTASMRSTARARSRLRACELLLAFGQQLTDEARLDRLLPYAMALLEDDTVAVKIAALRTITQLLSLVTALSPINAFIFTRYVFPRLQKLVSSSSFADSPPVRAVYASCLASLATTASRFQTLTQAFRADGSLPSADPEAEDDMAAHAAYQTSHDVARTALIRQFEAQTKIFLTDEDSAVRRAFLSSVPSLCVFFGDSLASDLILTHLNTYLNDEDWALKCALFKTIVGVAACIGRNSLEKFILPLMVQALTGPEETVTEQVLRSLSTMAWLGLFGRTVTLALLGILVRFTLHPNSWIREAAAQFIASSVTHLPKSDVRTLVEPLVAPVLKIRSADLVELDILDTLKKCFPRPAMEMAKVWASRHDKSAFWKPAKQSRALSFDPDIYQTKISPAYPSLARISKSEEDEQWLSRLRNAGMRSEDESALLMLRDYIWLTSLHSAKSSTEKESMHLDQIISLTSLRVPLQNVLFEDEVSFYDQIATTMQPGQDAPNMTLADALDDAARATPNAGVNAEQLEARIGDLVNKQSDTTEPDKSASTGPHNKVSNAGKNAHRENAFDLIRPGSVARKAVAETGTDSVIAVGKLDIPSSRITTPRIGTSEQPSPIPGQPPRIDDVRDPAVSRYLNSIRLANYSVDVAEFGPLVDPVRRQNVSSENQGTSSRWRPQGQIVAALGEHTSQVTCLAVSPDHVFFVTGSTDGTVRLWDTARLERNVTHRSRQVHRHASNAAITSLCFIERTHTFLSAAADGSINVVKTDISDVTGTLRYGKLRVMRNWQIPAASGHAVRLEHFRQDAQSTLLILTSRCSVLALDLRAMNIMYELSNPPEHGIPTSFCIHRRRQWLVVATKRGVLDLWDMRFRMLLRSWTFPDAVPIHNITLHPGRRSLHRTRICIAGGTQPNHVSIWDLEKQVCTELFHAKTQPSDPDVTPRSLNLLTLDAHGDAAKQLATTVDHEPKTLGPGAGSVCAFAIQMHASLTSSTSSGGGAESDSRQAFVISAGPDFRLRFWDADRVANSVLIGGTDTNHDSNNSKAGGGGREGVFSSTQLGGDTKVYSEMHALAMKSGVAEAKSARYDVIRASARGLLSRHTDQVTCVGLLDRPYEMVISCDRSGMIYIFR